MGSTTETPMTEMWIKERIQEITKRAPPDKLKVFQDTSEFMNIQPGHVLELDGRYYLVRGDEVEGRFGIDEQPKFWVKKAVDLQDASPKILKLVFHESFVMHIGDLAIQCFRSPRKEGRILDKVRDDPHFMHGFTVHDKAGNTIRIIERIQGRRFYSYINNLQMDHRTYFTKRFPDIFDNIVACVQAVGRLHRMGEVHGDIRNDHIFIEHETGLYRWIDFDYTYEWSENPFGVDLFGFGNILLFAVGKGFYNLKDLAVCDPTLFERSRLVLEPCDLSLFFKHRIINLKKLFPYIPESLNRVLMHFGQCTEVFYESALELLEDLGSCRRDLERPAETSSVA